MPEFSPGARRLLGFWGVIQAGVAQRASTADLWSMVRDAAAAEGVELHGANAIDLGQLRSLAAGNRNAGEQFARAAGNLGITTEMIGTELWSRAPLEQGITPRWLVRFQQTTESEGEQSTGWRAASYLGNLPATKQQLLDELDAHAQDMAVDYDTEHIGIGDVVVQRY